MSRASTIIAKSPRKVRLMIDPIRGMRLSSALHAMRTMPKGQAKKIHDVLKSAASNAQLTEGDYEKYAVSHIVAEEAQRLYRVMPRARGSAFKVRRRYSRVKVELQQIS